jgi:site-specific DNA recombinase
MKKDKENNQITKAIIYCRVSSKRQEIEGSGLESQEKRCRQYCEFKGYEVSDERIFRDSFTGGGDFMQRPAMKKLFNFLDNKSFDNYVIVFDDIKRLARDTKQHFRLRSEFKNRNCIVKSPNYEFDESEEGEFVETVFAAQAQLERKQNARQVKQKMKARLERGLWPFG